jgi:hypothetical protein
LKSNGIVSFIIIQAQSALKKKGATDLTPWTLNIHNTM